VVAVAAATAAGWLLLFFVLLVLPPASRPRRDERAAPGIEPPAVVSLLAGRDVTIDPVEPPAVARRAVRNNDFNQC
jgi:hypothetical protein